LLGVWPHHNHSFAAAVAGSSGSVMVGSRPGGAIPEGELFGVRHPARLAIHQMLAEIVEPIDPPNAA
jgi:hypothetical protein